MMRKWTGETSTDALPPPVYRSSYTAYYLERDVLRAAASLSTKTACQVCKKQYRRGRNSGPYQVAVQVAVHYFGRWDFLTWPAGEGEALRESLDRRGSVKPCHEIFAATLDRIVCGSGCASGLFFAWIESGITYPFPCSICGAVSPCIVREEFRRYRNQFQTVFAVRPIRTVELPLKESVHQTNTAIYPVCSRFCERRAPSVVAKTQQEREMFACARNTLKETKLQLSKLCRPRPQSPRPASTRRKNSSA